MQAMFTYDPAIKPSSPLASLFDTEPLPGEEILWIYNGSPADPTVELDGKMLSERRLIQQEGWVKIITSHSGTRMLWSVFARNWGSLQYAVEYLLACPGPFQLDYFIAGWFSETIHEPARLRERLLNILAKSDIHLRTCTFVREADHHSRHVPELLAQAMRNHAIMPEYSVDVAYDDLSGNFMVGRVGVNSLIARYYGLNPVSFPCQSFHSYHHTVSEAYSRVLKTSEPHYDHVLAAFHAPDATVRWFGYQRVILPMRFPNGMRGVSVASVDAPVNISVI